MTCRVRFFKVLSRLGQVRLHLLHFLAVLVDVDSEIRRMRTCSRRSMSSATSSRINWRLKGLKPSCTASSTASLVLHCSIFCKSVPR